MMFEVGKKGPPDWAALKLPAVESAECMSLCFGKLSAESTSGADQTGCHEAETAGFGDRAVASRGCGEVDLSAAES